MAYETIVSNTLKQERGQFFTHRNIIRFMVEMLDPDEKDMVLDPACGSGGFLVVVLDHVRRKIARELFPDEEGILLEDRVNDPRVVERAKYTLQGKTYFFKLPYNVGPKGTRSAGTIATADHCTTGTGSGKSLAYLVLIVDYVLRHGNGRGIQAMVVYPMNALADGWKRKKERNIKGYFTYPTPNCFSNCLTFARSASDFRRLSRYCIALSTLPSKYLIIAI
ncbi:MAG: N-6 DNA methylase [Pelotomaculum sp.]|nr:N-6 DNA methylase [Pelotomaculum sp.]